jgi:hypothetical protein
MSESMEADTSKPEDAAALVTQVRARLLAGLTPEQSAQQRRRLMFQMVTLTALWLPRLVRPSTSLRDHIVYGGLTSIGVVVTIIGYRRLRPGPRASVSDREVARVVHYVRRCPHCAALLVPTDGGECPSCGRAVPRDRGPGVLIALAVGLLVIAGVCWYIVASNPG